MSQVIFRKLVTTRDDVKGFTVPVNVSIFFKTGTFFNVYRSGNSIVFESGTNLKLTKKEIENYEFKEA